MNPSTKWIQITDAANIPPREGRAVRVGNWSVAVFNVGDRFLAVENRCPHLGGPLADGIVGGDTVTCPMHNWKICIESGAVTKPCETGATGLRTFPVKVEGNVILLGLEEAQQAA